MSPNLYSKYKSKYFIDPVVERQAVAIVNALGSQFILEGAAMIGGGDFRIFIRDIDSNNLFARVFPINVDLAQIDKTSFDSKEAIKVELPLPILLPDAPKEQKKEEIKTKNDKYFEIVITSSPKYEDDYCYG